MESISALREVVIDALKDMRQALKCPLCEQLLERPHRIPCNHVFCYDCIIEDEEGQCPECQAPYDHKEITRNIPLESLLEAYVRVKEGAELDIGEIDWHDSSSPDKTNDNECSAINSPFNQAGSSKPCPVDGTPSSTRSATEQAEQVVDEEPIAQTPRPQTATSKPLFRRINRLESLDDRTASTLLQTCLLRDPNSDSVDSCADDSVVALSTPPRHSTPWRGIQNLTETPSPIDITSVDTLPSPTDIAPTQHPGGSHISSPTEVAPTQLPNMVLFDNDGSVSDSDQEHRSMAPQSPRQDRVRCRRSLPMSIPSTQLLPPTENQGGRDESRSLHTEDCTDVCAGPSSAVRARGSMASQTKSTVSPELSVRSLRTGGPSRSIRSPSCNATPTPSLPGRDSIKATNANGFLVHQSRTRMGKDDPQADSGTNAAASAVSAASSTSAGRRVVVLCSGLKADDYGKVVECCRVLGGRVADRMGPEVTHLITKASPGKSTRAGLRAKRTLKYFTAILHGVWIVDLSWLVDSKQGGAWKDEVLYEVAGDNVGDGGPRRARRALARRNTRALFRDVDVSFLGRFKPPAMPKQDLSRLLELGEARVLDFSDENRTKRGLSEAGLSSDSEDDTCPRNPQEGTCASALSTNRPSKRQRGTHSVVESKASESHSAASVRASRMGAPSSPNAASIANRVFICGGQSAAERAPKQAKAVVEQSWVLDSISNYLAMPFQHYKF